MYGSNSPRGINEGKLQDTVMQLYSAAEKLKSCFNLIDGLQEKIKDCYKSDNSQEYQRKFYAFRNNFDIVVGYIEGYAMDLNKVRLYHDKIIDTMVADLNKKVKEEE